MANEWLQKARRYARVSEIRIKPNPKSSSTPSVQQEEEAKKVLKLIGEEDIAIVLDERGKDITSQGMAQLIAEAGDMGSPLTFCIGGPYGHTQEVRERANKVVRLSSLVLNHEVARVVLFEQLYRAWTILKGHPYHH
ncbi:unnamed protein product [Ostreobium quekettii]|uniref:Ribosomal RNA large subunit methyltransferase H n=1 Tax=Ostreobium quekettii TaxID=121088 RepID=A0A8S1IWE1_9CHLO|nr:unnamed protein product [Ostreobium quekettii]|eukprot:evm.model.scf_59.2 EVM.evm.TU.scf_59.2   scf_59:4581-7060(+)